MTTLGTGRRVVAWQVSFIVLGAIWGCSIWWIKLGLRAVSPVNVAFARLVLGASTLLVIAAVTRTPLPREWASWRHLFIVAVLLNSAPFILVSYGETHLPAALAGLINACTPLSTMIVALFVLRQESSRPMIVAGLGIGLVGVLVVIGVGNGFGTRQLSGIGACIGAVICYGFGFTYARSHLSGLPEKPVALAAGRVSCGTLQLLPFSLVFGRVQAHRPLSSLLALGALGGSRHRHRLCPQFRRRAPRSGHGGRWRHVPHSCLRRRCRGRVSWRDLALERAVWCATHSRWRRLHPGPHPPSGSSHECQSPGPMN